MKQGKPVSHYYIKYCCWCGGIFKLFSDGMEMVHTESKFSNPVRSNSQLRRTSNGANRLLRPSKIGRRLVKDGICGGCKDGLLNKSR